MKIGIIGLGRLGVLISKYLGQDFDLVAFDSKPLAKLKKENKLPLKIVSLNEVCQSSIIIIAVPISEFEKVVKKISLKLLPGTLVIDVCSVKEHPVKSMQKFIPKDCYILGTHPMFGPDSAEKTLWGSKLVLCPTRLPSKYFLAIKNYLQSQGLQIITTTPTKHDKEMSETLLLTHLIGRTLIELGSKSKEIDSKGYRRLMRILETVENDSWQLFFDMNNYNRFSKDIRINFQKSFKKVCSKIKGKSVLS